MPPLIDLTGRRFGRLVVIKQGPTLNRTGQRVSGWRSWICKCDCGNTHMTLGKHLTSGGTQSCGCLRRESAGRRMSQMTLNRK